MVGFAGAREGVCFSDRAKGLLTVSHNRFGHLFHVTTFGESHGPSIGCVVDGAPSRIRLDPKALAHLMARRRPGTSRFVTQRREPDQVHFLSGVLPGENEDGQLITTGTPIAMLIHNEDARGRDYREIGDRFRPGHADYTYHKKYGVRDVRGGGRSSARETAMRVAAGYIASEIIKPIRIRGALIAVGEHEVNRDEWDWNEVERNPFFCPDKNLAERLPDLLDALRSDGSSIGALVEIIAEGVPAGLGAPVYGKLDADLAGAMMSINAVKGVEVGAGFAAARLRGEDNADEMRTDETGNFSFLRNRAGGILGGISSGAPLVCRFAVKPTSSIRKNLRTVNLQKQNVQVSVKGRHDPCVGIRAVPVGEAMMACVLADHLLRARALGLAV